MTSSCPDTTNSLRQYSSFGTVTGSYNIKALSTIITGNVLSIVKCEITDGVIPIPPSTLPEGF